MSSSLPPEILDFIVDFLHAKRDALRACCLVSKSWVHRTRRHIFVHVKFSKFRIDLWKKTFPDPSDSPARYARNLSICTPAVVTSVDTSVGGLIRTFSGIIRLYMDIRGFGGGRNISFVPLRGLSPTLKTLCLIYDTAPPPSEIFGFVCSFPLLENLALVSLGNYNEVGTWSIPLTSPKLTGCLVLRMPYGFRSAVHRLLELPGGLRFSKIMVSCPDEDIELTADLISKCSDTLEFLEVVRGYKATNGTPPLDLSKLTRLKEVVFERGRSMDQWIARTLETAESINLQHITIRSPIAPALPMTEPVYLDWQDLDRVLLQFWTSRSIRPKIMYNGEGRRINLGELARGLLPELTSRRVVDLVKLTLPR